MSEQTSLPSIKEIKEEIGTISVSKLLEKGLTRQQISLLTKKGLIKKAENRGEYIVLDRKILTLGKRAKIGKEEWIDPNMKSSVFRIWQTFTFIRYESSLTLPEKDEESLFSLFKNMSFPLFIKYLTYLLFEAPWVNHPISIALIIKAKDRYLRDYLKTPTNSLQPQATNEADYLDF